MSELPNHLKDTYDPLGEPLRTIIFKWKLGFRFDKPIGEHYHQHIDARELADHIVMHRSIENGKHDDESWKELEKSLIENGWDSKLPLLFFIRANGKAAVMDANHRLKIVLELYDKYEHLRKVPVLFHFSEVG